MTRNLRNQLANAAERWMRAWAGDDLARESAEVLYTYWDLADPNDDELRAEVLSRFSPAEPPAVAGLDFLAVEQDAKTIVAETLRPNPLAELLPDTGGWNDDTSRCARCGTAFVPSWATHCVPCDGPMRVVSGGASKLRTFEDAHGCTWRENGEWLTLLDADGKDSGLNKTRAFVQQHYGPLREVTP